MYRYHGCTLTVAFGVTLTALLVCSASAQITVTKGSLSRSLPGHFYGANGQSRNSDAWDQTCGSSRCNPGFAPALQQLNLGVLRFPAGTGANYWDWSNSSNPAVSGDFDGYYVNSPSTYASPLPELQNEIQSATQPSGSTSATVDFVLNLVTQATLCTLSDSAAGSCVLPASAVKSDMSYDPSGPGPALLSYQISMLNAAQGSGINITNVELGNELYSGDKCVQSTYPNSNNCGPTGCTGTDYAGEGYANVLSGSGAVQAIKNTNPQTPPQVAVPMTYLGNHLNTITPRQLYWNESFMGTSALPQVDAVVLHIYPWSDLENLNTGAPNPNDPFGSKDNPNTAAIEDMLAQPFVTWSDINNEYLNSSTCSSDPDGYGASQCVQTSALNPNVWFTEYNLRDTSYAAFGTWAHGLYVGTMSLKFLEDPRVMLATHHETLGGAMFADIFDTATGFQSTGSSAGTVSTQPICAHAGGGGGTTAALPSAAQATVVDGLSAVGDVQKEINAAALGQTNATMLEFSSNPMITDPTTNAFSCRNLDSSCQYPSLYAWIFGGGAGIPSQVVILNLGGSSQTLDVSALASSSSRYRQISGFPGDYITGAVGSGGKYKAFYIDDSGAAHSDTLTMMINASLSQPNNLSVPAYSITRITVQ